MLSPTNGSFSDRLPLTSDVGFHYRFGRASLRCDRELPTLTPSPESQADVLVVLANPTQSDATPPPEPEQWLHHWRQDDERITLSLARSGEGFLLRAPELCDFDLQPASRQIRALPHDLDAVTLEHLLVDQVLPRYFSLQGRFYLHASAVRIGGQCALFLGRSGWGKSTLAGCFERSGHEVLSDDCVEIEITDTQALAAPTYASLRMLPDSLEALLTPERATSPMAQYSQKRRVALTDNQMSPTVTRIRVLYLLDEPDVSNDGLGIEPASPAVSCLELIRHAFQLDLGQRELSAVLLRQCGELARRLPVWHLRYPRRYDAAEAVVTAIRDHFLATPDPRNSA